MNTDKTENHMYTISSSPHAHSGASVQRIMLDVIIALVPALAASFFFFGLNALRLVMVCVLTCVFTEAVCRKTMKRNIAVNDLSAVVTGILLAFNLPPAMPSWMAVVGSFVAIFIAKQVFGGLGYNPFNPALVARVVLLVSRAPQMTAWSEWTIPGTDAVTSATPLGLCSNGATFDMNSHVMFDFFIGRMNGCIGEVSVLAILIGGLYLLYRRCISWHTPVFFIGTVALFSGVLWLMEPAANMNPMFHVLTGGLMLGAVFMATDMVTTPVTKKGMMIFGIGCGVITMVIRKWSPLPEGVSFAILLMNSVTPLINRATKPRVFGTGKE
ncbi:RnfABCDGE type electron transport complex subunit D [Verrucomicrobiota bacterium]